MAAKLSQDVKAEPNLVPMLDMVFQLITFFVLLCTFKAAEVDLSLKLPVIGSARPVDTHGQRGLLVLNIDKDGELLIYGSPVRNIESYIRNEAQASVLQNRMTPEDIAAGEELPTTVVIRADRATPFRMINRVIRACQDNGFRNFALKATNKEA